MSEFDLHITSWEQFLLFIEWVRSDEFSAVAAVTQHLQTKTAALQAAIQGVTHGEQSD